MLDVGAKDSSAPKNDWYFDGVPLHPYANPMNSSALPSSTAASWPSAGCRNQSGTLRSNAVPWDDPAGPLSREPWRW